MMSQFSEMFIRSVLMSAWQNAMITYSLVPQEEGFRVLAVLDRADLQDFACHFANTPDDPGGVRPFLSATIETVLSGKLAPRPANPKVPRHDFRWQVFYKRLATFEMCALEYLRYVVEAQNTPLGFSSDLTDTLPQVGAKPPGLTDASYEDAANSLDVEVEAIKAVSEVESGRGGGFEDGKHPTIRYELHQFNQRTKSVYLQTHPWLAQRKWDQGKAYHNLGQQGEYSMLYNAMILGRPRLKIEQALSSASWGRFQVMGFNYQSVGWTSVIEFVLDMYKNEGNQLKAFVGFLKSVNLESTLQKHDWEGFARAYNGGGQVDQYGGKMKTAYERLLAQRPKATPKPQELHAPTR